MSLMRGRGWAALVAVSCVIGLAGGADAQSRGVYPLGMSAVNSGVTPGPGLTYSNQLLLYSRDEEKADDGETLPVSGNNSVLMDMNTLVWVGRAEFLGGARYSAFVTLPVAKNQLTSDIHGRISGGAGFADSYYVPFVLGWNKDRFAVRLLYGFLAPTGRFHANANDNVGSGYWTHAFSSGQTLYLSQDRAWALSTFEMYEIHTTQRGSGTRPGDTFDLDYSLARAFKLRGGSSLQVGLAGYEQRQTTATTGPTIPAEQAASRYAVNAIGFASNLSLPRQKANLSLRFFDEFGNRSTFQGYALQLSGSVGF